MTVVSREILFQADIVLLSGRDLQESEGAGKGRSVLSLQSEYGVAGIEGL